MAHFVNNGMQFTESKTSDQKRLARGEQWLLARSCLRERDMVHNRNWRVLILSGMNPSGEINCIRELMPKSEIVAVDTDEQCVEAARSAGADICLNADLGESTKSRVGPYNMLYERPNNLLDSIGKFDAIHLDFCAGATEETKRTVRINSLLLSGRGVMIVTFSYGRDVVEVFQSRPPRTNQLAIDKLNGIGINKTIVNRIAFAVGGIASDAISVVLYKGNEMPMCSVLCQKGTRRNISFVKVEPGDFELAVTCPDPSKMYDCPSDRIESLRRSAAAIKASITRRERSKQKEESFTLV
jgi:hypothetical protein